MKLRMLFLSAVASLGLASAIAAPAMAQDDLGARWGSYHQDYPGAGQPDYRPDYRPIDAPYPQSFDPRRGDGGGLREREQLLADWMRAGVDQGWLRGWEARRAFGALSRIQNQDRVLRWRNGGYLRDDQRFMLSQRLDDLGRFLHQARDTGGADHPW
jgi:hypothetical protein